MRRKRPAKKRPVIDKSQLKYGEERKIRDEKYLKWIATLQCAKTAACVGIQACHIRLGSCAGTGTKPSDDLVVPLHHEVHAEQHTVGEATFWGADLDRAKSLAADLYRIWLNGADRAEAVFRVMRFQRGE